MVMNRFLKIDIQNLCFFVVAISLSLLLASGCASPKNENKISKPSPKAQKNNTSTAKVSTIAKQKINVSHSPTIQIQTENLSAYNALPTLYQNNNLYWISAEGPTSGAYEMIEIVRNSSDEALNPADYNLEQIESTLVRLEQDTKSGNSYDPQDLAELELLLSNSFLKYAHDVHYGRVRIEQISSDLPSERPENITELLITGTSNNQVEETLNGLFPKHPMYEKLKISLKEYRQIAANGGWQSVPYGDKFEKGARGNRVVALRERLKVTGELDSSVPDSNVFDGTLDIAVRKYQETHGLYVDGVVGKSTIESLNVPVEQRVAQIELTMERWRLLPQYLGSKYILVNIANFHLYGVENNSDEIDMRIVVGKPEWNTPMFSEEMTHIVMNPYWNIPPSIFKDDLVPRIKQDPSYMSKRGIDAVGLPAPEYIAIEEEEETVEVAEHVAGSEENTEESEPQLSEAELQNKKAQEEYTAQVLSGKYRLRQNPGPSNPLGQIKFLFPNKHSVYLHDTPNRGFFKRAQRNFSHGCIRVQEPIQLAEFVLEANPDWTQGRIKSSINSRKTKTVHLNQTIPVYILYFTAWVDDSGNANFHKDIYGLDQSLLNALRATRPNIDIATSVQ